MVLAWLRTEQGGCCWSPGSLRDTSLGCVRGGEDAVGPLGHSVIPHLAAYGAGRMLLVLWVTL